MLISDRLIRRAVKSILAESFKIDAPLGREYSLDVNPIATTPLPFAIEDVFISNLIDTLTSKRDGTNLAWRYIAEGLLINNAGFKDLNLSNPQFIFADVEKSGIQYSVKSSFQKGRTSAWTPISNHPIYTNQILKKSDLDRFGVITCHRRKSENNFSEIVWTKIGTIIPGSELKEKARKYPGIKKIRNIVDFNTFFDEEQKKSDPTKIRGEEILVVKFKDDIGKNSDAEAKNTRLQKINFVVNRLDTLTPEELDSLVRLVQDKIKPPAPPAV